MKKLKFLSLAVVAFTAFSFASCGGAEPAKEKETEEEKVNPDDEKSEFYDKDAIGEVIYFNAAAQA